jgi:hypothetical protein
MAVVFGGSMAQQKIGRFCYWKKEIQKDRWKLISDTESAKKEAIAKGAMYFTWVSFSEPYESENNSEPIRYGDLPLDFDSEKTREKALKEMRWLCLTHLVEIYNLDPYEIKFYCSGSKGFHAVIPAELLGAQEGDPYLPIIYKQIVSDWAERFGISSVDHTMYAMGKGKMFRIPNVRRSNGRYKVPLTLEEVRNSTIKEIWKLSEKPRNV